MGQKGFMEVGKEMPVQALATLEKRFWARLNMGPPRAAAKRRFLQGLGQGLWGTQDNFGPKRCQSLKAPLALAFGGACLLKDRLAQACRQVILEELNGASQLDTVFRGN